MIKSPLRYPGGKNRAIKFIAPLIPDFSEYREPFVGGGSVFVHLKQKFPEQKFWINDIYKNLVYFWKYCQNESNKLTNQIIKWKLEFNDGKKLHKFLIENIDKFDELGGKPRYGYCWRKQSLW